MKFFFCSTCTVYSLQLSNRSSILPTSSSSTVQLLDMFKIPEGGIFLEKGISPYLTLQIDDDKESHDSGISVASDLSSNVTNFRQIPLLYAYEEISEAMSLDDLVSLDSHESRIYENIQKAVYTVYSDDNRETIQCECAEKRKHMQCPAVCNTETPKIRSKRLKWRKPFQNTANFQLDSGNINNCFRRGQRRIKNIMRGFQNGGSNDNDIKITSIKHIFEDPKVICNFEDISLWPRNPLPESLHVNYSLKTVDKPQVQSGAFKSISSREMARIMQTMSQKDFNEKFILIDCRYPYEYAGGHVKGAVNICDWKSLKATFYPDCPAEFKSVSSRIPIFYCEFSQKRGPQLAEALRKYDRKRNEWRYPEVDYKEVYLLDGGYKKFFEDNYTHLCEPPSYTTMLATPYREDLKRFNMHRSRSAVELTAAINRTFESVSYEKNAKVRHSSCLLNSPTQFLETSNLLRFAEDVALTPRLVNTLRFSESPEPKQ